MALLDSLKKIVPQSLPLQWEKTLISDQFAQWKQTLLAWQARVDVVYLLSANAVKDEDGNLMSSAQAIDWIGTHSQVPEIACWAYQVEQGALVSATDDGAKQGELSAMLTLKILKGASPGDLPIITPPNGVPVLNLTRAEKLEFAVPQELISLLIDQDVIYK